MKDSANGLKSNNGQLEIDGLLHLDDKTESFLEPLSDLTLNIEQGRLLGICGSVGSGKSSLLAAITGDVSLFCNATQELLKILVHFLYGNYFFLC